jgi:hypothetical protein
VDLSGLIFVALAVAWAAYLIPKALRHHDDVVRGRSVDRFSQSMRVLARREPVSARAARLVVRPARTSGSVQVTTKPSGTPLETSYAEPTESVAARRAATVRATRRRRRVLSALALALAGVVVACALGRITWAYVAIPGTLLAAWLVACRLMVKKERGRRSPMTVDEERADDETSATIEPVAAAPTAEAPASPEPGLWDPVPVTLPTYVSKPPARRAVRTIDLDSTGVWTSGRTEADSALARGAEAAERVRRRTARKGEPGEEAVGS